MQLPNAYTLLKWKAPISISRNATENHFVFPKEPFSEQFLKELSYSVKNI